MIDLNLTPWLAALAWALCHFLWEGALIGLVAWVLLRLARGRSPELRYLLACGALAAMALAFLATAWACAGTPWVGGLSVLIQDAAPTVGQANGLAWGTGLRQGLEACLPGLLSIWSMGVLFMVGRLTSGLLWLQFVCLRTATCADPVWEARLDRLVRELGLGRKVRLRVSERLDSPVVVGSLRPLILVPMAVLAAMDPGDLEAVLAHELAHIRRHDYLANLLQSCAELLFFYHPAFWWVAKQIRLERELCCDDAAVRQCGDAFRYASALAALEAFRSPHSSLTHLAPAAKGGSLMLRIRRILTAETHLPTRSAALPVLTGLTLILGLTVFSHGLPVRAAALAPATEPPAPAPAPTAQATEPPAPAKEAPVSTEESPAPAKESPAQAEVPERVPFSQIQVANQPAPPAYPAEAKAKRIQGVVVVEITVNPQGQPTAVKATEGPEELWPTAVGYASQWSFKPFLHEGKPVAVRFRLTMPFKLR